MTNPQINHQKNRQNVLSELVTKISHRKNQQNFIKVTKNITNILQITKKITEKNHRKSNNHR